jgi:hypothetical protein
MPRLTASCKQFTGQDTKGGADFLTAQEEESYGKVMRNFFNVECDCKYLLYVLVVTRRDSIADTTKAHIPPSKTNPKMHTRSSRESHSLQQSLPPLSHVFKEKESYDPGTHFSHWQTFLARQPVDGKS